MKEDWCFAVVLCCALLMSVALGAGATPDGSSGILFLHLRATAAGFELVEAKTVNGALRTRHYDSAKAGLHVEVRSVDNRVLFRDVCPEPRNTRLEYEDPQQQGKIVAKAVAVPNQEFTIRVPYFSEGRTIHFYRRLEGGVTGGGSDAPLLIHQGQVSLPVQ